MLIHVSPILFHTVPGEATYTLYLLSNSHIGLDQQFELRCNVTPLQGYETTHTR